MVNRPTLQRISRIGSRLSLMVLLLATVPLLVAKTPNAFAEEAGALGETSTESGQLSATSGSNRFVVWHEQLTSANAEIYLRRSTDNGATWKPVVNLSKNPGQSWNPQIAVTGSNVYIVWQQENVEESENNVYFRRSVDNGVTWGPKVKLSTSNAIEDQRLASNPSGDEVYVIWRNVADAGPYDIFFRRSTDNGASWEKILNVSNTPEPSGEPKMIVNGQKLFILWSEGNDDGTPPIFLRSSLDAGASWQDSKKISNDDGASTHFDAAASGNNVYVAWHWLNGGTEDETYARSSTDNGATWSAIKNISKTATATFDQINVAASGTNVWVFWREMQPGGTYIFFARSTDSGATWKPSTNLSASLSSVSTLDIGSSGTNVYVTWGSSGQIRFINSVDSGATWSQIKSISPAGNKNGFPILAASGVNLFVVWNDDTTGNSDTVIRRSTDGGASWKTAKNLSSTPTDSVAYGIGV